MFNFFTEILSALLEENSGQTSNNNADFESGDSQYFQTLNSLVMTSKRSFPHVQQWRKLNPSMKTLLMTDKPSEDFIKSSYPEFYDTYMSLAVPVEKADLFRYLAVHKFGGVYADTDVIPLIPVKAWAHIYGWKHGEEKFSLERTLIIGIEFPNPVQEGLPLQILQWTFASSCENHPALLAVAQEVRERVKRIEHDKNDHDSIIRRTGPIAFTSGVLNYIGDHSERGWEKRNSYPDFLDPISEIQKNGQFIELHEDDGTQSYILLLPYRAFGFHPWHGNENIPEPKNQHLVHHLFEGSWRN